MDEAQLSHWIHSIPCSVQELVRAEKSHMFLMGFEPTTFQPSVWSINHYAVGLVTNCSNWTGKMQEEKGAK